MYAPRKAIGLIQLLLYPAAAFILSIMGRVSGSPVPASVLSAIYPIGLLLLAVYPSIEFRHRTKPVLKEYLEFARGAWYATIAIAGFAMVHFLVSSLYNDTYAGWGFLFVSVGAIWLPQLSAAGAYGILLRNREDSEEFRKRIGENHAYERAVAVFLGLLVGKYDIARRDPQAALLAPLLLVFYVSGWVVLSLAGGFPATLFGLSIILLIPFSSYLYLKPVGKQGIRLALSDLLKQVSWRNPSYKPEQAKLTKT